MAETPDSTEGVSFRLYREGDLPGIVSVLNAASRHAGVERHETVETTANMYRNLTNCDLETDLIVAERAGTMVGYRRCFWYVVEDTNERMLTHVGWSVPEVEHLGIGALLLGWSEQRLGEMSRETSHDGDEFLLTWSDEREVAAVMDLEAAGYTLSETYAEMVRSLSEPIEEHVLPEGVEIRPVGPDDRRRVWEADQDAFRDHVGYSPGSEADFQQFLDDPTADIRLWKVAFAGDVIVGQVLNYVNEDENREFDRLRGWTESISTHRDWRGKGVARAVITESIEMFRDMGMGEVALGVHTTNPTGAYRLYEGLGYRLVAKQFEFRKEMPR